MIKIKIDPEFRDKIPAMADEQFKGLREDILRDGYVRDPLVVWKEENILLDGHHRWRVICENWETLKDHYTIDYKSFDNRWAALEWICRNQLNKHNLNDEQISYIRGEMYKARKKNVGEHSGNQYTNLESHQNDVVPKGRNRTARQIAHELGIGQATVERDAKFTDGVNAIRRVSKEAADKVMRGNSGVTKKEVMSFPTMAPEEKSKFVDDIVSGAIKTNRSQSQSKSKEERELRTLTESIAADMYDPDFVPEFTIDMLIGSIKANSKNFTETLSIILKERKSLITDKTRDRVEETIDKYVIEETVKIIKELVNK